MKWFSVLLLLIAFCFISCKGEVDQSTISGRYVGTQKFGIGQASSPFILIISQRGNSIVGQVTPPFSGDLVDFQNGQVNGSTVRFDRKVGNITYRYEGTVVPAAGAQSGQISGGLSPLGCINPSAGEPCLTDSSGSFTGTKQ